MSRWWSQTISFKISTCSIVFHHDTKPEDYSPISNLAKSSGTTADRGRSRWESFRWGSAPNRASTWLDKESFYHNESCQTTMHFSCGAQFHQAPTLYTWHFFDCWFCYEFTIMQQRQNLAEILPTAHAFWDFLKPVDTEWKFECCKSCKQNNCPLLLQVACNSVSTKPSLTPANARNLSRIIYSCRQITRIPKPFLSYSLLFFHLIVVFYRQRYTTIYPLIRLYSLLFMSQI